MCSSSLAAWRFGEENVDSKGRRSHQHNAGPGLVGIKFHRDINLSGEQLSKSNCENNPGNPYLIYSNHIIHIVSIGITSVIQKIFQILTDQGSC